MIKSLNPDREVMYKELESHIGGTPLYKIKKIHISNKNSIYCKEEYLNPSGSTFDRFYPWLFRIAEENGLIIPNITPVIESSSGNAGASFAYCAKKLGYNDCTVILHSDTPKVRIDKIERYGAKVILAEKGTHGLGNLKKLEELLAEDRKKKGGKIGENPYRMYCLTKIHPRAHESPGCKDLVEEVYNEIDNVDIFVSGIGSGTTLKGMANQLREKNPNTKIIAFEPSYTPTVTRMSGVFVSIKDFNPRDYELFGLGVEIPANRLNIDLSLIDEIRLVTNEDWKNGYEKLSTIENRTEVGRVSAATLEVALKVAEKVYAKNILICFGDSAKSFDENYLYLK